MSKYRKNPLPDLDIISNENTNEFLPSLKGAILDTPTRVLPLLNAYAQ